MREGGDRRSHALFAVDHFSQMFLPDGPAFHGLVAHAAAPLVINCAVRAGRLDDARRLMDELEAMAERMTAPWC